MADPAPSTAATPAFHIGRYRVLSEIGRGGMGIVYRCEDERIGRSVSVKTLTEATPELRDRFYIEARAGILSHPNIVTVYELGEDNEIPFIAMEFLNGESLESIIRARGRLSLLDALPIVQQLCDGLGYAHSQGLLHRDVKPANVIVLPDGAVKIVDFGIARLTDQQTRLTRTDSLLGTFHYIAPERLKGHPSDGRADLWSAGVILYELITGALPFRGEDVSTLYRMMHEPFVPIAELVPSLPPELTPILDRALAKELDQRYRSAEEMAIDLRALDDQLKHTRVGELLSGARQLFSEEHLARARTLTLQAQRLAPTNTTARLLLEEITERLNRLHREEQLRQLLEQAEEAVAERQLDQAVSLLEQAEHIDPKQRDSVVARLEQVRALQEQSQRVRSLCEEANQARTRGDLTAAQRLLSQALELDTRSTSIRQAHALIQRDLERQEQATRIQGLLRSARVAVSEHRYTEAVAQLREAAEVDPTHAEVQQLLLSTSSQQRQQRRREALEQVVSDIQDCLDRNDLARAADRVNRALETLPHEPTLLRIRGEIDSRTREQETEAGVRAAILEAQRLFEDQPTEAIALLGQALTRAPGDSRLLEFRQRLVEHQAAHTREEVRQRRLHEAERALQKQQPDEAVHVLEVEASEGGDSPEIVALLSRARDLKQTMAARAAREVLLQQARHFASAGEHQRLLDLLRDTPETQGDPEFSSLSSQSEHYLRDLASRRDSLLARAESMASQNITGALRLLQEQPPAIIQSPAVLALTTRLVAQKAQEETIAVALQTSREFLARGDFRAANRPLEKLTASLGEGHAALRRAREEFRAARQQMADSALQSAMAQAHRALSEGAPRTAMRELKNVSTALPFASSGCQKEASLLEERVAVERAASKTNRTPLRRGSAARTLASLPLWARLGIPAVTVLALVSGVETVSRQRARHAPAQVHTHPDPVPASSPLPASSSPSADLVINAAPWATVIAVQNSAGKAVSLQGGEQATPLRIGGLVSGTYTVTLRGPDNQIQKASCSTNNAPDDVCNIVITTPNIEQLLAGAK